MACNSFVIGGLAFGRHWVVDRVPVPATLMAALTDLVRWLDVTKMPASFLALRTRSILRAEAAFF